MQPRNVQEVLTFPKEIKLCILKRDGRMSLALSSEDQAFHEDANQGADRNSVV